MYTDTVFGCYPPFGDDLFFWQGLALRYEILTQIEEDCQISVERQVCDSILSGELWQMYDLAQQTAILRNFSAQRQVLSQEEFCIILEDVKILKFLVWWQGKGVGIIFTTNNLEVLLNYGAGKWLSPDFYAYRFGGSLTQGKVFFFLNGAFDKNFLDSNLFVSDFLVRAWTLIVEELKKEGAGFLAYDYSKRVVDLIDSIPQCLRRLTGLNLVGVPQNLGAEVYKRFKWPQPEITQYPHLCFGIGHNVGGWPFLLQVQTRQKTMGRVFAWLDQEGLIEKDETQAVFEITAVPFEEITPTLIDLVYAVAKSAFSEVTDNPDPRRQLTHNQRSPHRQLEGQEEFAKDLYDPNCRLFVGRINGRIIFFCLFRLGLDEKGSDGLGEGGMTCLNYVALRQHLGDYFKNNQAAFILCIGFVPACQGLLPSDDSLGALQWMINQVLSGGGIVGYDFARTINRSMETLPRWLGWVTGNYLGLPLVEDLCDSQIYEVVLLA